MDHNRRRFIASSGQALGAGWVALHWPAISAAAAHAHEAGASTPQTFKILNAAQVRDLDALSALIIPTDDTPGAHEAGVVYFMDNALGGFFAPHRAEFLAGYDEFATPLAAKPFADLTTDQQLRVAKYAEGTPFFAMVRILTVVGFLASPRYGGNRDGIGWQVIGFSDEHVFSPPFGYYDRDYAGFVPYTDKGKA